jgi:GDPmannose 4,6-dehydratase
MFVADLREAEVMGELLRALSPEEVYYLAAHHFSSQTDENRIGRLDPFVRVNLMTPNAALETIAEHSPRTRFFYAGSAHIFGTPAESPQNEATPHRPETPYALSKSAAVHLARTYRDTHGVFACSGILYNHESPRRGPSFVTTQIARAAALASLGRPEPLAVRDLEAVVDWGHARDYVRAMWLMLRQESAEDYIVASGVGRTVREFAQAAFSAVGLGSEELVVQGPAVTQVPQARLVGDSSRLRRATGWQPEIEFGALVEEMVLAQRQALSTAEA